MCGLTIDSDCKEGHIEAGTSDSRNGPLLVAITIAISIAISICIIHMVIPLSTII